MTDIYNRPALTQEDIALDHTPLRFGKYKGQTPDEISEHDPGYIVWMFDTIKDRKNCSQTLANACRGDKANQARHKQEVTKELDPLNDLDF